MNKSMSADTVVLLMTLAGLYLLGGVTPALANHDFIVQGVVSDVDGKPVSGADVSAYYGKNVKKPADFTSNRTEADGVYKLALPEGHYWLVAVFRKDGRKFGPLGLDDKHSGGATELDVGPDEDLELDFTVMGLRDAARAQKKTNDSLVLVSGQIIDEDGAPVSMAYAMANTTRQFKKLPKYISAWTDKSGTYSLYLPRGSFYLGAALGFPPNTDYVLLNELTLADKAQKADLIIHSK